MVPDVVVAGTVPVTVIGGNDASGARVSPAAVREQVRVVPLVAQVHPGPLAVGVPREAGTVSVTRNGPTAVSSPLLDTSTVQENGAPATGSAAWVLVTWTSAESITASAVLGGPAYEPSRGAGLPSASSAVTDAALV